MLSRSKGRTARNLLIALSLGGLVLAAGCDGKKKEKEEGNETSTADSPKETTR